MFKELEKFRKDRGLENVEGDIVSNLLEELTELNRAVNQDEKIDALCDMIVFSVNAIASNGYDPEKCMLEVCKEINSRRGNYDYSINKWVKDKSEEATKLWYKADYDKCKK